MRSPSQRSRRHRASVSSENESQQPFFSVKSADMVQNKPGHLPFFQAKLTIGQPGDKYEQEADTVANRVVSGQDNSPQIQPKEISTVQRSELRRKMQEEKVQRAKEEEEEPVQMQEEEEEPIQMKVEEEEKVQKKEEEEEPIQMQEEEEEVQMQEEEEEPIQMQEEEEEIQAKAEPGGKTTDTNLGSQIINTAGNGKPLPEKTRAGMEHAFSRDLSGVKIHTDMEAVRMNKELGAQAFTHGRDIYFNSGKYRPENSEGQRLLAHELTHVVQQGAGGAPKSGVVINNLNSHAQPATVQRQGLLTPAQEMAAIAFNNALFDGRSKRIIQAIVGVGVDGKIGPVTVEGIAAFQQTNGLPQNGQVDLSTHKAMVNNRVANAFQEHAIQLVVDFHNLNTSDTLSIRHDPALLLPVTTFESGGLRVIRLGNFSFLTEGLLHASIISQLAIPAPAVAPIGAMPDHLKTGQEISAVFFNKTKFQDPRSVRAIQGLVGANPDGLFGQDTVERIAELQNNNGLTADGKVGEQTMRTMIAQLDARNEQNAAIRMIMDFYNLSDHGALLDISFDPGLTTSNATTGGTIPGPSQVQIGPPAFAQGFEGLVHTIAHELEHVRQRKVGILNQDLREYLGERIEILSIGMPSEGLAGFFDDARRALFHWNRLPVAEQRINFAKFTDVRARVRQRFNAASAADQATHQATMDGYNAVVKP